MRTLATPSRRRHSRPGPGRLHRRPGHRRRRQRPPAVATPPGGASTPRLGRGTCPARGEEL